jgi:hypothetical protein
MTTFLDEMINDAKSLLKEKEKRFIKKNEFSEMMSIISLRSHINQLEKLKKKLEPPK